GSGGGVSFGRGGGDCPQDMARLAEPVGAGEAGGEEADEEGRREADDVQVVALDAADEGGAPALDRVRARPALPPARRHVRPQGARRQLPELDPRRPPADLIPPRR